MTTQARQGSVDRAVWAVVVLALVGSACGGSGSAGLASSATRSTIASAGGSPAVDGANALVTRVVDGDTIEVRFRGRDVTVRLIGIDTPESVAPGVPVQCFAIAASDFTKRTLEGQRVRLEFDVQRTDRYGRTLAYVWLGEDLFNETLVRQGYAVVSTYPPDVKHVETFVRAQRRARKGGVGLWGRCVHRTSERSCDPSYPDVCIPPPPPDLDCADITFRRFRVLPPDPHGFDEDHNGMGCER